MIFREIQMIIDNYDDGDFHLPFLQIVLAFLEKAVTDIVDQQPFQPIKVVGANVIGGKRHYIVRCLTASGSANRLEIIPADVMNREFPEVRCLFFYDVRIFIISLSFLEISEIIFKLVCFVNSILQFRDFPYFFTKN
jgi:hypothetical protein